MIRFRVRPKVVRFRAHPLHRMTRIPPAAATRFRSQRERNPSAAQLCRRRSVYQQQRSGRNPLVTCLAIIGILTLGCCLFTVFVLPRVAVPVIEQIASQFPDIMETLTYDPNFQGMFATLEAGGGLSFGTLTSSGTFDRSEARDRGKIELGRSITGDKGANTDDYYTLTLTDRQTVTINLESRTTDLDPRLYVYDSSNQLVGENDDIDMGTNNDSRLTLTVSPGIYYVVVSAFGTGGEYTINLSN